MVSSAPQEPPDPIQPERIEALDRQLRDIPRAAARRYGRKGERLRRSTLLVVGGVELARGPAEMGWGAIEQHSFVRSGVKQQLKATRR